MVQPNDPPVVANVQPAESGKPDKQDAAYDKEDNPKIDKAYWRRCLDDAERAESNWRKRGREIIQIYRNETGTSASTVKTRKGTKVGNVYYNILYANTETMLPAIYANPPQPVVRSRFTAPSKPLQPPPPVLGGLAGLPLPGPLGPSLGPPVGPPAPDSGLPPELAPIDGGLPPPAPSAYGQPGIPGGIAPEPVPGMAPPPVPPSIPKSPSQKAIEAAASVMEKALEIVVDDELSHESIKAAIKDVLLPGRGTVRVRWIPTMKEQPVLDEVTGKPLQDEETGEDMTEEVKIWEQVNDEYVYWEDLLLDPVRAPGDMDWIAFRHLFSEQQLIDEFEGSSPEFDALLKAGKVVSELCKWTEESAAKEVIGGGPPVRSADKLGDLIKKCMAWEIWDRRTKKIIWFVRDAGGLVLRVDPDTYKLQGFYPIPKPILAVTTTDTQIPRPFYDLYANLANDLDETSVRISKLTEKIKVRGGYNSASNDIANLLTADDGKMLPVDGVDLLNGGLKNHIWIVPIIEWVNALKELYVAREQIKQGIYEIMGISDIMRGATKASETATAQRIKGSMGMVRLSDQKAAAGNFIRDLLRLKGELIAQNFDAETLAAMTGEDVTPEVMEILRSDFMRTCTIDIEADSTVIVDQQEEQQSMQAVMMSVGAIMTGAATMLQTGILPPNQVVMMSLELLKMVLHPVRFSRGVVELIDDFIEQLQAQIAMPQPPMAMPPPGAGGPKPPGGPSPGGPPPGNGAAPSSPQPPPGGPGMSMPQLPPMQ